MTKYIYYKVLQGHYGLRWEDLCMYDTSDPKQMKECKDDFKAYEENEKEYPHRVIRRKVLRKEIEK